MRRLVLIAACKQRRELREALFEENVDEFQQRLEASYDFAFNHKCHHSLTLRNRHRKMESRSLTELTLEPNASALHLNQAFGNVQAQAGTGHLPRFLVFGSEEFYEFCGESINDAFGFFLSGPGISGAF